MGMIASLFQGPAPRPQGLQASDLSFSNAAAGQGITQQQNLINALASQNGIGNQSSVFNQLQNVASGQGPNPAQAMLNQATGQNVANQAALAASQRGASGNVGLLARQAAQAGAGAQQQAAGQAATMQANQSLGALGQLGGLAGQQVAQQMGAIQGLNQAAQGEQGQIISSLNSQNAANSGMAQQQAQQGGGLLGGVLGGVGSALGLAEGGEVPDSDDTSSKPALFAGMGAPGNSNPLQSGMSQFVQGLAHQAGKLIPSSNPVVDAGFKMPEIGSQFSPPGPSLGVNTSLSGAQPASTGPTLGANLKFAAGGTAENPKLARVPEADRFAGAVVKRSHYPAHLAHVAHYYHGGSMDFRQGGPVPGEPKVHRDSKSNDTVPAMLTPKEIVLPLSVTEAKDAPAQAAKFVAQELAKRGAGKKDHKKEFHEALKRAIAGRKAA